MRALFIASCLAWGASSISIASAADKTDAGKVAAPVAVPAVVKPKPPAENLPPIEKVVGPGLEVGSMEDRPVVAGNLQLQPRTRVNDAGQWKPVDQTAMWKASETAIIVCDMWNDHYCVSAAQRVGVMSPKMNRVLTEARAAGVLVIHAPSGVMAAYDDWPQRKRLQAAPKVEPPAPIAGWCYLDPMHEAEMPVDTTKCSCDDPTPRPAVRYFNRQHPGLDIMGYDGISDSGVEIYNYFRKLGIKNVALMGVHTNMCVLGRSFGIRQQTRLGMNTVLVRDLTDAMYDPRQPPYVSHTRGTQMVIEHVEKYWCPSIDSEDLTKIVPGSDGP